MPGRALPIACLLVLTGAWPAAAQMLPPGGGQVPPCYNDFAPLKQEAEKRALAAREANAKKASPQETCALIGRFSEAEAKVVKFVEANGSWCGIPPEAIKQMKANHEHTVQVHKHVCEVAANPARPVGPSLSDAFEAATKVPTRDAVKPGRGTFDTLTGNALAK